MNAKIGDIGHGAAWAGFGHESCASKTGYALLQHSDGSTVLFNRTSANVNGHFAFRINNVDKVKITGDGDVWAHNLGSMGHGGWYGFSHPDQVGQNSYALLQHNDGSTVLLNRTSANPNGYFAFRVNNVDRVKITGDGDVWAHNLNAMGHGGWYGFSHPDQVGQRSYALLQHNDGATTLINKKAGTGHIGFRVDNVDKVVINNDGNLGVGVTAPAHPIHVKGGAHVTAGGVWTNASSRVLKDNIHDLSADSARAALASMTPVLFNYKAEPEAEHVGFIAEDMPALATNSSRDGVSSMDVVAILTKVVQEQAQLIEDQARRLEQQDQRLAALEALN